MTLQLHECHGQALFQTLTGPGDHSRTRKHQEGLNAMEEVQEVGGTQIKQEFIY